MSVNKDKKRTKNNNKQRPPRRPYFWILFTFAEVFAELKNKTKQNWNKTKRDWSKTKQNETNQTKTTRVRLRFSETAAQSYPVL